MARDDASRAIGKIVSVSADRLVVELHRGSDNFTVIGFDDVHYVATLGSYLMVPTQSEYVVLEVIGLREKDFSPAYGNGPEMDKATAAKFLGESAPHGLEPAGEKRGCGRLIGRTKGGLNTKLHAVTDAKGRPLRFFMTAGQVSDYTGAAALLSNLPAAEWLIADRGYDADWFREALKDKGIRPCIPGRKSRGKAVRYDKRRYRRRNRIEIMFGRLKDWRRVATRYDRCPKVFLSAIALAATVMFWL